MPKRYDFISAWDSIWHAPLAEHEGILQKLCGGLKPGGVLIFTSGGLDAPEGRTNELMGQPVYHATLGLPRLLELVAGAEYACRHLEYDQYPELHVYLIMQKSGEREPDLQSDWKPPRPQPLGWMGLTDAEIKDHAQGWVG